MALIIGGPTVLVEFAKLLFLFFRGQGHFNMFDGILMVVPAVVILVAFLGVK
jgi:hypothetical protein